MNGAKANIILDNVEIRQPYVESRLTVIYVDLDSEVNIYLKGENVLYNSNGTALQLYGTATVRIYDYPDDWKEGSLRQYYRHRKPARRRYRRK
jgi:hypothetical protein